MPTIRILPENVTIELQPGETLLSASLRAGVWHAHDCGGNARCSTCRIEITQGVEACAPRTSAEHTLAERLGFGETLRLACQTIPHANLTMRRLVLDDDDAVLVKRRLSGTALTSAGEERELAILFSDIRGFTSFSEMLPPHDVVHVLNRYFHLMGPEVDRFGGSINNYMGDGLMALFGIADSTENQAVAAVRSGLAMLAAMDAFKPYLRSAYGSDFDIRIGIHYGDVVVGSVGATGQERTTAIGDAVNFASRIEAASKVTGTRLLVSETIVSQSEGRLQIGRSVTLPIAGKHGEYKLFEVVGVS